MRTIVVYDSVFGNTKAIAQAIADAVEKEGHSVKVFAASDSVSLEWDSVDLLILGSPTRAFRPTKAITDFIDSIPAASLSRARAAVFDTRISLDDVPSKPLKLMLKTFGYADKKMVGKIKRRRKAGSISTEAFFVKDTKGPLYENELERAAQWARGLVAACK